MDTVVDWGLGLGMVSMAAVAIGSFAILWFCIRGVLRIRRLAQLER